MSDDDYLARLFSGAEIIDQVRVDRQIVQIIVGLVDALPLWASSQNDLKCMIGVCPSAETIKWSNIESVMADPKVS